MIISFTIIILLILSICIIGLFISEKILKKYNSNYFVIGFLSILSFLQICTYIPAYLQMSFDTYSITMYTVYIIMLIIATYKTRDILVNRLKRFFKSYIFLFSCIFSLILSIDVFFNGLVISDSWLYLHDTLAMIQNNVTAMSPTSHYFDSYYYFCSLVINISTIDQNIFAIVFYHSFEIFAIVLSMSFVYQQIFKRYCNTIFTFSMIAFACFIPLFVPNYQTNTIIGCIYTIVPVGTMFLYGVTVPFLFIYLFQKEKSVLWAVIISFSGLAFSSSSIYIIPITISIFAVFYYLTDREYLYKSYYIVIGLIVPVIISVTALISLDMFSVVFFVLAIVVLILAIYIIDKFNIIFKKRYDIFCSLFVVGIILFICFCWVVFFFHQGDFVSQLNLLFNTPYEENYNVLLYEPIRNHLIEIILLIIGAVYAWKSEYRSYLYFSLLAFIMFGNQIMYFTFGQIINQQVYHRVMQIVPVYILYILAIVFIVELILKYFNTNITKVFLCVIAIMACIYGRVTLPIMETTNVGFHEGTNYKFDTTLINYKSQNEDISAFLEYQFPPNSTLCIPIVENNITNIFMYNTTIEYSPEVNDQCYQLIPKNVEFEGEKVYETPNYYLYAPTKVYE